MHRSVMEFTRAVLPSNHVLDQIVLDVGSRNVNGTLRDVVLPSQPRMYIGIDIEAGPGVDLMLDILDAPQVLRPGAFDIVLCAETLEHVEDWAGALQAMMSLLRRGGTLVITVRSPGFARHDYPGDHWRFTEDDMRRIFVEQEIAELVRDTDHAGVMVKVVKKNSRLFTDLDIGRVE